MKTSIKFAMAAAPFLLTAVAHGARLQVLQSEVYLDRGNGFQQVSGTVNSVVGLKLLVKDGGKARIECSETSSVTFESPGVYEITDDCAPVSTFETTVMPEAGLSASTVAVLGLAAVGVGVAVAVSGGDDDPASK